MDLSQDYYAKLTFSLVRNSCRKENCDSSNMPVLQ